MVKNSWISFEELLVQRNWMNRQEANFWREHTGGFFGYYNPEDHLVLWHDNIIYPLSEAFRVAMRERGIEVEEEDIWQWGRIEPKPF